jgi:hypothetical protein
MEAATTRLDDARAARRARLLRRQIAWLAVDVLAIACCVALALGAVL